MYLICFTTLNALNAVHNSDKEYNKHSKNGIKFIHTAVSVCMCMYLYKGRLVNVTYLKSAQVPPFHKQMNR